jgi:CitMHS family citrate-Mg2+:H+ or citrate-Ca2+:H+ symporter
VLACVVSMAAGVNFLPWTGPTLRASAALKIPVSDIFRPMVGVQAVGLVFVFCAAWWLGQRETRRLAADAAALGLIGGATGSTGAEGISPAPRVAAPKISTGEDSVRPPAVKRPGLFWVNLLLTLLVMSALVSGLVAPAVAFMVGTVIALLINYPGSAAQRDRVDAHAHAALAMAAILLAAGAFTGVMTGTGALKALAQSAVSHLPPGTGSQIPFLLSLVAMPLSMLFDPDSFYFGVLPVIAEMHARLGGTAVQVAQAALVGQMTAGFPVSPLTPATFLVSGLAGIELSAHQKFAFPYLYAASLTMALACVLFGLFPA